MISLYMKIKKVIKKYFLPISKRWDFLIVFHFILIRLILNLKLTPLTIFFAVSYIILLVLMFTHKKSFFIAMIMFLFVDSLIGTILYTTWNNLGLEYLGTMGFNLIVVFLLIFDINKNFNQQ